MAHAPSHCRAVLDRAPKPHLGQACEETLARIPRPRGRHERSGPRGLECCACGAKLHGRASRSPKVRVRQQPSISNRHQAHQGKISAGDLHHHGHQCSAALGTLQRIFGGHAGELESRCFGSNFDLRIALGKRIRCSWRSVWRFAARCWRH